MNNKPSKRILSILLAIILAGTTFVFGYYLGDKKDSDDGKSITDYIKIGSKKEDLDLDLFWEIYDLLDKKYVEENLNEDDLVYGAIEGMVNSLGDVHSYFMDPEKTSSFEDSLNSVYEGIGAYVGMRDDTLTVISPLKDSPAEKAGVQPGDKIIQIDETLTIDLTLDEAIGMLKGEKGTVVKVTLVRGKNNEVIEAEITRDVVDVPSVEWNEEAGDIVYLKINKFEKGTTEDIKSAIDEFSENKENKKLLLDLRDNPGGYFDEAVDIVGLFAGKNKVAVIEEKRDGDKKEFETDTESEIKDWPIVILVNGSSASASEIVAGALRDQRDVKLVGTNTYGKGSVQEYNNNFEDGSSLKITIAKWLTPNGTVIDGQGLKPDYEVEITSEDYNNDLDPQLDKAKEVLEAM